MNSSNAINLARYLFIKNPSIARKVVKIIQGPCRCSHPEVFCKKVVLRNFAKFAGKHLCQNLFLIKFQAWGLQLYLKKTLALVFSCEFCEISNNTFSYRTPPVAAFELRNFISCDHQYHFNE